MVAQNLPLTNSQTSPAQTPDMLTLHCSTPLPGLQPGPYTLTKSFTRSAKVTEPGAARHAQPTEGATQPVPSPRLKAWAGQPPAAPSGDGGSLAPGNTHPERGAWNQLPGSLPPKALSELRTPRPAAGVQKPGVGALRRGPAHLSFREAEAVRQLLSLGAHHVVVFLEGVFQPQKLGRGKGGSDPLRLSGQRVVQKEALGACVIPCGGHSRSPVRGLSPGWGRALLRSRAGGTSRSGPLLSVGASACGAGDPLESPEEDTGPVARPGAPGSSCATPNPELPLRGQSPGS